MADNAGVTTSKTPKYPTLTMLFMTFPFLLPVVAFPLTDITLRAIWAGRPAATLLVPPVLLSFITGGASIFVNYGFVAFGYMGADYLYFTCANISYIILFLFGSSFYLSV